MRLAPLCCLVLLACPGGDDDDSPTPWPTPTSTLFTDALPECEAPTTSPGGFTEALPGSGVDFVHASDPEFLLDPDDHTMPLAESVAAGVVAADLDGDGHVDLFFPQTTGPSAIYWGLGGARFEAGTGAGVELPDTIAATASTADFDGDGLLDLAVGGFQAFHLLRNRGDRTFEDVTASRGLTPGRGWPGTPTWADVDGDGDLDLYEGRHAEAANEDIGLLETAPDALWRNDGDAFVDVHDGFGLDDDGAWLHGSWRDLDGDGDVDLVHVNDFGDLGPNSFLWENAGGGGPRWIDRLPDSGIGRLIAPMGVAVRDLDGDGRVDLLFSDIGRLSSFAGVGPFEFVDTSVVWLGAIEHGEYDTSWSVVDIDLDGDGRPSVFVAYGPLPAEPGSPEWAPDQRDRLLEPPLGDGPWEDLQGVFPSPAIGNTRGAALADLNADGVPDLVLGRVREAPSLLLGRCTAAQRLVVQLRDPGANRFGIGARVTVEAGGRTQVQDVVAGGRGTYSGSAPDLFFGLGDTQDVTVTVRWPDGDEERFEGLEPGRIRVERRAR